MVVGFSIFTTANSVLLFKSIPKGFEGTYLGVNSSIAIRATKTTGESPVGAADRQTIVPTRKCREHVAGEVNGLLRTETVSVREAGAVVEVEPGEVLLGQPHLGAELADLRLDGGGGADIGPTGQAGNVPMFSHLAESNYFQIHHTPADTVERITPKQAADNAAAIAVMAYVIADLPWRLGSEK